MNNGIVRSSFNWIGNKIKYINIINELVGNKVYDTVYEPMMGSANILLNISCQSNNYIGNDIMRIMPNIYNYMKHSDDVFVEDDIINIINLYGGFNVKEQYYTFRDDWNTLYSSNVANRDFVLKTVMLFKMCSNSVIRFNRNNRFNSGFRGITDGNFFKQSTISNIIKSLNQLNEHIKLRNYAFTNDDYFSINFNENSLIILDPPYLLSKGVYNGDMTENQDWKIIEKMVNSSCDFLYFNNEFNNGDTNHNLSLLNNYPRIQLATLDCSGQNRRESIKTINEILIYRIT